MSPRARQREAQQRELDSLQDWRDDRDKDDEEIPEPEPDEPVNTMH